MQTPFQQHIGTVLLCDYQSTLHLVMYINTLKLILLLDEENLVILAVIVIETHNTLYLEATSLTLIH